MEGPLTALNSRHDEESRLVARWLIRLEECLGPEGASIFNEAMRDAGVSQTTLDRPEGLRLGHLNAAVVSARRHRPEIRLRLMAAVNLTDHGLMGFAAMSSDRIIDALRIATRYHDLTSDRFDYVLDVRGETAYFRHIPKPSYLHQLLDIAEDAVTGTWRSLELLIGPGAAPDFPSASVHFAYPAPDYVDVYHEVFPCPCHFDAERTELRVPAAWLDRPVATANPAVAELCNAMCEQILGPRHGKSNTPDEVARLLLSQEGRRILPLEEAAEKLNMSPSQLRKRLYRAGTSYKRIVVETRMALARHYLETSRLPVQNIAYLLDYSEAAAFTRAFKREVGVSPQDYREQAVGQ
jgi:AraC-like DNA-binding protein